MKKKSLTDQITQLSTSLETIKKDNKNNESLTRKITELQTTIEENKKKAADTEKRFVLRDALRDKDAKYIDLLETKFDLSKIEIGADGKIKDFDTHLNPVKESYKELFGEKTIEGKTPGKGTRNSPD